MAVNPLTAIPSIFGRFLGKAISDAGGYALGGATADVLRPRLQVLKNDQNASNAHVPPGAGDMAKGVAQGQIDKTKAAGYAAHSGIGADQFDALVAVENVGPDLGLAYEAWRRGLLSDVEFTTALKRTGLEEQWNAALKGLRDVLLTSTELANMQQQGFVDAARANSEGGLQGVTEERQQLRFDIAGLPPGPETGLDMLRRGIIDQATFEQIIREGHTKIKYTADYVAMQDHVLPHLNYVEARVRGYITNAEMYAGGKLTGYTQEQMDLLHKTHGRPLSFHQIWVGIQRGGVLLSPTDDISPASTGIDPIFFKGLQQSNIQQQWYDIAWHLRWNYPPPFVLRLLTTTKVLTEAETAEILKFEGYEPTLIEKIATAWAGGTTTTATQKKQTLKHLTDEYLVKAITRPALVTALLGLGYTAQQADDEIKLAVFSATKAVRTKSTTAIGKRFIALQLTEAEARADLAALGWPDEAIAQYVAGWNAERDDEGTTLTQKQVLTAFKKGTLTAADALARLTVLGASAADAQILLDSQ